MRASSFTVIDCELVSRLFSVTHSPVWLIHKACCVCRVVGLESHLRIAVPGFNGVIV